ncbi:MAG: thiamine phosphate synthase, partial [Anaerotignum sp.]|nr:thiamine phosphate synthase [Anaerotignum sp.]
MKCKEEYMRLYAVTDRMWTGKQTLMEQVEDALKGGATCVQLREKELDEESFLQEAYEMKALCEKYGVPFFINDNVEIAIKCKADGIHVGQDDMEASNVRALVGEDMMIGVSVNCVEQALAAVQAGADCLGVGAMFNTSTKLDADSVSFETLKEICNAVDIPVVAIGGISKENMMQLKGTDVDGVALVSAIFGAENIEEECKELRLLSEAMVRPEKRAVLSIAGSDCSGGAGIQADLKTMTMNGVFAMSAITALTAQNTTGVQGIFEVSPAFLGMQIDSVFTDIRPHAVKIGMVSSVELIEKIAEKLKEYKAENIVIDPVMVATSGSALMKNNAVSALAEKLLPLAA